jgi:hypothetical protein
LAAAGQRLFYVPELQGAISGDYSWHIGDYEADVGADWSYTGNQYDVTNFLLPSYTRSTFVSGRSGTTTA